MIVQYKGGGPALADTLAGHVHMNLGSNWWGIVAPAGTQAAILARLREEIAAILDAPEMRGRFEAEGAETARLGPAEFSDFIAAETAKWTRVVKDAGIKAE